MGERPSGVDVLKSFKGELISPLLLRQPITYSFAHDPAFASIETISDLVHPSYELGWELGCYHSPFITHVTYQSLKIKTNNVQYGPIQTLGKPRTEHLET